MKKFRGKRRYFRNLWSSATAEHFELDFGSEGWFDLWHTHLDFYGRGNSSLKIRKEHIRAHLALYKNLLEKLDTNEKPYQSWVQLNEEDAGLDAVYIHTPNPNEDNFPFKIEKLNWNCMIPEYLKDVINLEEFNVGYYTWESNGRFIIQSKHKGTKLEGS
ncbi:hypothetical protein [Bacillus sp. FJAT-27445]|uniref:hypothetical protein n=1 Tax=Bacillus sp. FJAT-27445 TaxID=1679166 RepID=UPI00074449CB|nr:hypothetical protein [Bacillus sp. FJAT-27445]